MINSKTRLAIILSKLKGFENPSAEKEQYPIYSEIGAEILWTAHLSGDIEGKIVADLGCGTGLLGIGALLLGAKKVFFLDIDGNAIKIAKANLSQVQDEIDADLESYSVFDEADVVNFNQHVDTVITNPPFGVQRKHADRPFIEKACELSEKIYYVHKEESEEFLKKIADEKGFDLKGMSKFKFPIRASQIYHSKPMYRFNAAWFKFERKHSIA